MASLATMRIASICVYCIVLFFEFLVGNIWSSRVAVRAALWRPYRDVNDRDINFESFMSKAWSHHFAIPLSSPIGASILISSHIILNLRVVLLRYCRVVIGLFRQWVLFWTTGSYWFMVLSFQSRKLHLFRAAERWLLWLPWGSPVYVFTI